MFVCTGYMNEKIFKTIEYYFFLEMLFTTFFFFFFNYDMEVVYVNPYHHIRQNLFVYMCMYLLS